MGEQSHTHRKMTWTKPSAGIPESELEQLSCDAGCISEGPGTPKEVQDKSLILPESQRAGCVPGSFSHREFTAQAMSVAIDGGRAG